MRVALVCQAFIEPCSSRISSHHAPAGCAAAHSRRWVRACIRCNRVTCLPAVSIRSMARSSDQTLSPLCSSPQYLIAGLKHVLSAFCQAMTRQKCCGIFLFYIFLTEPQASIALFLHLKPSCHVRTTEMNILVCLLVSWRLLFGFAVIVLTNPSLLWFYVLYQWVRCDFWGQCF